MTCFLLPANWGCFYGRAGQLKWGETAMFSPSLSLYYKQNIKLKHKTELIDTYFFTLSPVMQKGGPPLSFVWFWWRQCMSFAYLDLLQAWVSIFLLMDSRFQSNMNCPLLLGCFFRKIIIYPHLLVFASLEISNRQKNFSLERKPPNRGDLNPKYYRNDWEPSFSEWLRQLLNFFNPFIP